MTLRSIGFFAAAFEFVKDLQMLSRIGVFMPRRCCIRNPVEIKIQKIGSIEAAFPKFRQSENEE